MRGPLLGDLQRPCLVAAHVNPESVEREQRQRLHRPQRDQDEDAGVERFVAVLDERLQHLPGFVENDAEQDDCADDADQLSARPARRWRRAERSYRRKQHRPVHPRGALRRPPLPLTYDAHRIACGRPRRSRFDTIADIGGAMNRGPLAGAREAVYHPSICQAGICHASIQAARRRLMNLIHTKFEPAGDGPHPTIIALHGWGANALDLLGLAPYIAGGRFMVVCPQGPLEVPIGPISGYGWFPIRMGTPPSEEQIDAAVEEAAKFIDDAIAKYPV